MLRLHRALDETVDVAVLEGAAVRFIDHLQSRQLDQIRIDGVAYDHQEHTQGISAVGAAASGRRGVGVARRGLSARGQALAATTSASAASAAFSPDFFE